MLALEKMRSLLRKFNKCFLAAFITCTCLHTLGLTAFEPRYANSWFSVKLGSPLTFNPVKSQVVDLKPLDDDALLELGFIFTPPEDYKGPISLEWPPSQSRNTSLYIRPGQDTILSGERLFFSYVVMYIES